MENDVTWRHDGSRRLLTVGDVIQRLRNLEKRLPALNYGEVNIIGLCLDEVYQIPGIRVNVEEKPKSKPASDDAMEISKVMGTKQVCELTQMLLDMDYDGIKVERIRGSDFKHTYSIKYWRGNS